MKTDPLDSKRWLIIRNGAVGDTVLLSPLIQCLRRHDPSAWIEVMGIPERAALLVGEGLADRAQAFDRPGIESLFASGIEMHPALRSYLIPFDCILYFGQHGLDTIQQKLRCRTDQNVWVYPAVPQQEDVHITRHYCRAIEPHIGSCDAVRPKLVLSKSEREWGLNWIQEHCERYSENRQRVAMHVGAGSKQKQAPLSLFYNALRHHPNPYCLIPQGPADESAVHAFLERFPKSIPYTLIDSLPLRALACVLSHCDAFMGNDSGVTHIAAALGIPTTVVFTASNPRVWTPLGALVTVVDCREKLKPV